MNRNHALDAYLLKKDVILIVKGKKVVTKINHITAHGNCILDYENTRIKPELLTRGWKTYREELREKVKAIPLKDKNIVLAVLKGEYNKEDGRAYALGELSKHLGIETMVLAKFMGDIFKKSQRTYSVLPERLDK